MLKRIWIIGAILLVVTVISTAFFLIQNDIQSVTMTRDQKSSETVKTTNTFQSPMMYRADAARTGNYNNVSGGIVPKGQLKWKYELDSYEPGPPIVGQDAVYLITPLNGTFAINATTGVLIWNNRDIGSSTSAPAVAGGSVFIPPWDLYSIDAETGSVRWRSKGGNSFHSSPAFAYGSVYIGNGDKNLYAFNPETGQVRWNCTTIGSVNTVAVADGRVYATSIHKNITVAKGMDRSKDIIKTDSRVYALNVKDGTQKWVFTPLEMLSYCGPVVADGIVYIGTDFNNNILYALDAQTGAILWNQTINISLSSPAIAEDTLYIGSEDNHLYALDAKTGAQKWKFSVRESEMPGGVVSSPAYADGVIYFGDLNGNLYALDAKTGTLHWTFTAGGYIWSSPFVSNGVVYFSGGDGYLYAIE